MPTITPLWLMIHRNYLMELDIFVCLFHALLLVRVPAT